MKLKVDRKNDTLYFRLNDAAIIESEEVQPGLILDYDSNNNLVGIEILNLTKRVPELMLNSLLYETV